MICQSFIYDLYLFVESELESRQFIIGSGEHYCESAKNPTQRDCPPPPLLQEQPQRIEEKTSSTEGRQKKIGDQRINRTSDGMSDKNATRPEMIERSYSSNGYVEANTA
uniref:Uncharacterized protein n=1 Tax=Heterorhabditis bacteriophora TaxID=37862 RepID=A0A1I7WBN0_HETBA